MFYTLLHKPTVEAVVFKMCLFYDRVTQFQGFLDKANCLDSDLLWLPILQTRQRNVLHFDSAGSVAFDIINQLLDHPAMTVMVNLLGLGLGL